VVRTRTMGRREKKMWFTFFFFFLLRKYSALSNVGIGEFLHTL
jgi:hypothetical protein